MNKTETVIFCLSQIEKLENDLVDVIDADKMLDSKYWYIKGAINAFVHIIQKIQEHEMTKYHVAVAPTGKCIIVQGDILELEKHMYLEEFYYKVVAERAIKLMEKGEE